MRILVDSIGSARFALASCYRIDSLALVALLIMRTILSAGHTNARPAAITGCDYCFAGSYDFAAALATGAKVFERLASMKS
jgi:hypothetical protein